MRQDLIRLVQNGEACIVNDGSSKEALRQVMRECFPNSSFDDFKGNYNYYYAYDSAVWNCSLERPHFKQYISVGFFCVAEPSWEPKEGEMVEVKIFPREDLWQKMEFVYKTKEGINICLAPSKNRSNSSFLGWKEIRQIKEPEKINLSVAEIEKKLGYKEGQLHIVKDK